MLGIGFRPALFLALAATSWPMTAAAQDAPDDLMGLDKDLLRGEIGKRYDEALALTLDNSIVSGDNPRFLWASQAKAQCGISLGFLKSGTKDPVSIGKCDDAYRRMQLQPPPPPPPPTPAPVACNKVPSIVFFDWNRADISAEAAMTLDTVIETLRDCGNPPVALDGYTDTSGTESYNGALSERRAAAVRAYLTSHGVPDSTISTQGFGETKLRVPTADGVRELQNRRVEVTVK